MKKSQSIRDTQIQAILEKLVSLSPADQKSELSRLVKQFAKQSADTISKSELLKSYRQLNVPLNQSVLSLLKKKPIRTLSGVTPITVLTKPYPCPGECIFCPVDVRMPKSYIASEPGAQRAGQYGFDPYLQVYNRLKAYYEIGHPVGKIELIILGGTWSVYPKTYQRWFITKLFKALNDFGSHTYKHTKAPSIDLTETLPDNQTYNQYISQKHNLSTDKLQTASWDNLLTAQKTNEVSSCRCVGLVLETRPDYLDEKETIHLRKLGATKIQIGIQSLSDEVLSLNKRGHTVKQTRDAIQLLRQAGFKIHAHWMPNLYGSNPKKDTVDFDTLFSDPAICPDELKVYPCSLIPKTELINLYQQQKWQPYTRSQLQAVLGHVLTHTPEYCRLTRIIRDIPGGEILAGNKSTNMRQIVEQQLNGSDLHDIRSREIKGAAFSSNDLTIDDVIYQTSVSKEHFLQYITPERKIAAFLRLSIPSIENPIMELAGRTIIREIHVYGQSVSVGNENSTGAQHLGMGKQLIERAKKISREAGYSSMAVISAVGTREYYRKLGFKDGDLYQSIKLTS